LKKNFIIIYVFQFHILSLIFELSINNLKEVIEGWIIVSIKKGLQIPIIKSGYGEYLLNILCMEPGIARGPHEHIEQTDIFAFIGPGNFRIQLWYNRDKSPSFGNSMIFFGGEDNPILVVVPPGVVHGYKNVSRTIRGMVLNYPDRLFMGHGKKEPVDEVRHEDAGDEFYKDFIQ